MRLINADALMENYGLENATKYGNKNAEQQAHSYSTLMLYEIAGMIENEPTAFDLDKVLEELKGQAEQYRRRAIEHEEKGFQLIADKNYSKACSYEHAIEIVKAGVKNE